jgi:hypothetical protein
MVSPAFSSPTTKLAIAGSHMLPTNQDSTAANAGPSSSTPPAPSPEEVKEQSRNFGLGVLSAILAVGLAYYGNASLTRCADKGHLLAICQKLDKQLPWLNQQLAKLRLPNWPALNKVLTKTSAAAVMEEGLKPHIAGALAWVGKQLPASHADQWKALLGPAKTVDDALAAIKTLRTQLTDTTAPPVSNALHKKTVTLLDSLESRFKEGLQQRYLAPYNHTQNLIKQGNLHAVGQGFLHFVQSVRQLVGGDFATQTLGKNPGKLATILNGLLIFSAPVYAFLKSDWPEKLKASGEELWGNAFGNFVGWYWGTQWLNHWGGIPRILNQLKPGLANAPIRFLGQKATLTGLLTELVAIFGVGSIIAKVGTKTSHAIFGVPRKTYELKLPPNYTPLAQRRFLSQETPLPQSARLTHLSDDDVKQLMTNTHALHDRKLVQTMQPRLDDLLTPGKLD